MEKKASLKTFIDELSLINLTQEINVSDIFLSTPDVNWPAWQLTGYFENFDPMRLQLIGQVEYSYMQRLNEKENKQCFYQVDGI